MASSNNSGSESFLSQVEKVREEIRSKFLHSHQILHEREAMLLSEIDQLVASYRREGIEKEIQQLHTSKESIMSALKGNENYKAFELSIAPLNHRIRELELSLETAEGRMRRVELEWDPELEGRLSKVGGIRIIGQADYKKKGEPVMTACKHSPDKTSEIGVFRYPESISIHSQTNNVYVCDFGNNRIQVFTSSFDFLFHFNQKMDGPCGICIHENKVYVTQLLSNLMTVYSIEGKFLQSVGKKGNGKLEFLIPGGVAISTIKNLAYICDYGNNRIQCLNLNLTFNSFILHIFGPRDIKLTQNEIVVLKGGYHCIYIFNYSHQFVREMIRCGEGTPLIRSFHICLDQQNNILMTDYFSHCVAIFSIRGELIRKFGKEGENRGEFIKPTGIALNSENRIIVFSENRCNPIQLF